MADAPPPLAALPAVPLPDPVFQEALRHVLIPVIDHEGHESQEEAYLIENSLDAKRAYQKWPNRAPSVLPDGRGMLVYANVLLRSEKEDGQVVFRKTDTSVIIKQLARQVIDPLVDRHRRGEDPFVENPYVELFVMQRYGDYQHIMCCYEALKDDRYLYIVTLACRNGDLQGQRPPQPLVAHPVAPAMGLAAWDVMIQVVDDFDQETTHIAYLQEDSPSATEAYLLLSQDPSERLAERAEVLFAQVLVKEQHNDHRIVYRRTNRHVVIKPKILSSSQRQALTRGEPINHPLLDRCRAALWDEENTLYIVTLLEFDGNLNGDIHWDLGGGYYPRNEVPAIAKHLLENLQHLQRFRLVHCDLKPENIIKRPPWFPLIDCALALQIPYHEGRPQLIAPLPRNPAGPIPGSRTYWSPEVFLNQPFNHKTDLWALGSILFNLMTGLRFSLHPHVTDRAYRVLILGGGFENQVLREHVLTELRRHGMENRDRLGRLVQAVEALEPLERNLLQKILHPDQHMRPEVAQVLQHPFFQGVM